MKKKLSLVLSLVILMSVFLAACQPAAAPEPETVVVTQVVEVEKEVEKVVEVEKELAPITIWARYDLTDTEDAVSVILKQLIDSYTATTGAEVNYEQVAWDQVASKLALQTQSGGDVPDLVEADSSHMPQLVSIGAYMDITDMVNATSWAAELNEADAQSCVVDGKRYCVAADVRGGAWYYNTADFPDGWPTTPEGWLTEGERLKGEGKYVSTFFAGRQYGAAELTWYPWIRSNGGHVFDEEGKPAWASAETVEVVEWARELLAKGYVPETCFTGDFTAGETPWVEGTAASVRGGSWSFLFIPGLSDKIGAGETQLGMSTDFGGGSYVFLVGEGWGIPDGAANPEGAMSFMNFFMNPSVLSQWAAKHYGIPTIASAFQGSEFDNDFYRATAKNLEENGIFVEQSEFYTESLDALSIAMQELMLDPTLDPLTHLQEAQDEIINRYFD